MVLLLFMSANNICVAALYERMRADQRKFGKSAWAAAVERMERLQYAVSKETLQLMRAKEVCLEQRKHGLKEEVKKHDTRHNTRTWITDYLNCVFKELVIMSEFDTNPQRGWREEEEKPDNSHVRKMTSWRRHPVMEWITSWCTAVEVTHWEQLRGSNVCLSCEKVLIAVL